MQELERQLLAGQDLTPAQVREAAAFLLDPNPEPERKAEFLRALAQKGETANEIAAFVREFLQYAVVPPIDAATLNGPVLDVVGTGGDKLNLFNVSTTSMFILAAGGVCIIKHGNRGITGKCGGADVLEALGLSIVREPTELARCVRDVGVGFIFAPKYHPAFQAVVAARKLLAAEGQRSIFNLLGPLLNPVQPAHQLLGVFEEKLVPIFAKILVELGRKAAWVVHGTTGDGRGMDELSSLGPNTVAIVQEGNIEQTTLDPAPLGFVNAALSDLVGGGADENADILEGVLTGRLKGPKRDLAVLNAAAGFVISGKANDLLAGKALAEDLLNRGAAHVKLRALVDWC
ncbi:MAG: anthranilate phosphoribosyltransferase [Roseimicrobium sp.]